MGDYFGRTFTPEGEIFGVDWAEGDKGEQKRRSATKAAEAVVPEDEQALIDAKNKSKNLRSALFATKGGSAGEEILSGGVKKRETIFGNA